jgi:hypothetical protein
MEERIIKLRKGTSMKKCIYSVELLAENCCNVYSNSKRPDGKWWAHWPKCSSENCPFEHPELLEGATFDKEEFNKTLR